MANGVVTPVLPVANDIILGECKIYANYNTPKETLIGATNGGVSIEINRSPRNINIDGTYGNQLDSSGIPLTRFDMMEATVKAEMISLAYATAKRITDERYNTWESQDWGLTGGTYTEETTIVNTGTKSAKMTASTTAHGIHEVFATSKDLTSFSNSESSGTSDYIGFSIYISSQDKTDLNTADLRLGLHCDAEDTVTNYYHYDITNSNLVADRWNNFKILKSAFTSNGSPSWATITGVSLSLDGSPSAEVVCYIDSIELIKSHSLSGIVPLNGGNFTYTNETTYRKIVPNLEISDTDYIDNITIISQKFDGKIIKIILDNCLNDGNIDLALQQKSEVVNSTTFTSHYVSGTTPPFRIREYV